MGTWSIDVDGVESRLEDLSGISLPVAITGYRLEEEADVIPASEVKFEAKQVKNENKQKEKEIKKNQKFENSQRKVEYKRKIRQMDMETMLKVKARQDFLKQKYKKPVDGATE